MSVCMTTATKLIEKQGYLKGLDILAVVTRVPAEHSLSGGKFCWYNSIEIRINLISLKFLALC